jgi:hypothetical protein
MDPAGKPADTLPKPLIVVLQPRGDKFDYAWSCGIKPACRDAGVYAERAEAVEREGRVLERIQQLVARADLVIADVTGRDAEVLYEIGYAHALGKKVILVARDDDALPFDWRDEFHVVYSMEMGTLKPPLEKRIRWAIDNLPTGRAAVEFPLRLSIGGTPLRADGAVDIALPVAVSGRAEVIMGGKPYAIDRQALRVKIDVHNASARLFSGPWQLGLAVPTELGSNDSGQRTVDLPDGRVLHLLDAPIPSLPDAWDTVTLLLTRNAGRLPPLNAALRVVTELGSREHALRLITPDPDGTLIPA